jgi:hypothetical protein
MEEEEHVECTTAGASVEEGDVAQEEEGSDGMEEEEHVDSSAKHTKFVPYTAEHKLSKYELLNSLNINLMDRGNGVSSFVSECQMNNLLREIVQFKKEHGEELEYSSKNDKATYTLVEVPTAKSEHDFYQKAKEQKWIDRIWFGFEA